MPRYVAFLRAVNVGKRRVEMARLRQVVEALGYDDVRTHINSGNVAFTSRARGTSLEQALEPAFAEAFGFEIPTFVRAVAELATVVEAALFDDVADGDVYLVAFARRALTTAEADAVRALAGPADDLVVAGRDIHWHIHGKSMDSGISPRQWEQTGIGPITTRNITMLRKLVAKESS